MENDRKKDENNNINEFLEEQNPLKNDLFVNTNGIIENISSSNSNFFFLIFSFNLQIYLELIQKGEEVMIPSKQIRPETIF